jgi:hypothetical protein
MPFHQLLSCQSFFVFNQSWLGLRPPSAVLESHIFNYCANSIIAINIWISGFKKMSYLSRLAVGKCSAKRGYEKSWRKDSWFNRAIAFC